MNTWKIWSFLLILIWFQVSALLALVADTVPMALKSWVLAGFSTVVCLTNVIVVVLFEQVLFIGPSAVAGRVV